MTSLKKISVLMVLFTTTSPAWSAIYDYCKVKKIYDANVATPPQIVYEDCPGIGFLVNGKVLAKADCWKDANDLLEGKCDKPKEPVAENTGDTPQADIPLE